MKKSKLLMREPLDKRVARIDQEEEEVKALEETVEVDSEAASEVDSEADSEEDSEVAVEVKIEEIMDLDKIEEITIQEI